MIPLLFYGTLFAAGVMLILTAQPLGAPRPRLAQQLRGLNPERPASQAPARPVFSSRLAEEAFRPFMIRSGATLREVAGKLGLDLKETETRLNLVGDTNGLTLFLGQKVLSFVVGFWVLPGLNAFGLTARPPVWTWLVAGLVAFAIPDAVLGARASGVHRRLRESLADFADLLALTVSSGMAVEAAVEQSCALLDDPLKQRMTAFVRASTLRNEPPSRALHQMAEALRLPEAESLATALEAAESQGASLRTALESQADSIRQRRRAELIELGEKAQVRMALPVGALILPAFLIVVLYPAAVQLMQVVTR